MEFDYSKKNAMTDAFSQFPCPGLENDFITQSEKVYAIDHLQGFPLTAKQLAAATTRDTIISKGPSLD